MHVLLTEDDQLIADGITAGLQLLGFTVEHVATAAKAQALVMNLPFDALILDLGLPDQDGLILLRRLRQRDVHLPVLVLTARDAITDRVAGLQAGADDYLLKPFDLRELVARLHTLQRRFVGRSSNQIIHGSLRFNPTTQDVFLGDERIELSRREQALLKAVLDSKGRIVTSIQLRHAVYGAVDDIESNALNVHIHNLRRKLGSSIVDTVRGLGYRLGAARENKSL